MRSQVTKTRLRHTPVYTPVRMTALRRNCSRRYPGKLARTDIRSWASKMPCIEKPESTKMVARHQLQRQRSARFHFQRGPRPSRYTSSDALTLQSYHEPRARATNPG